MEAGRQRPTKCRAVGWQRPCRPEIRVPRSLALGDRGDQHSPPSLRCSPSPDASQLAPLPAEPVYTAPAAYKETGAASVVPPQNPTGGVWHPASPSDGMLKGKWWEIYQDPQTASKSAWIH